MPFKPASGSLASPVNGYEMEVSEAAERVFERSPDIVARTIEDEEILVPIVKSGDEVDSIYTLNDVGRFVWGLIDGRRPVREIVGAVRDEFEGDGDTIDAAVASFIGDLLEVKAIRDVSGGAGAEES